MPPEPTPPAISEGAKLMLRILKEHGPMSKDELIRMTLEEKARQAAEGN